MLITPKYLGLYFQKQECSTIQLQYTHQNQETNNNIDTIIQSHSILPVVSIMVFIWQNRYYPPTPPTPPPPQSSGQRAHDPTQNHRLYLVVASLHPPSFTLEHLCLSQSIHVFNIFEELSYLRNVSICAHLMFSHHWIQVMCIWWQYLRRDECSHCIL